jgi:hypothetical protein
VEPCDLNDDDLLILNQQFEKEPPPPKIRKKRLHFVCRENRSITEADAERIVFLREQGFNFKYISQCLYLRHTTVFMAYRRMQLREGHHIDGRIVNGRKNPLTKITPELSAFLLNNDVLQKWSGLTLSQRIRLIERDHNIVMGGCTLRDFYRKHEIKYLQVSYMYY